MAPVEDPQIVVAVVVETSGYGATWAAPVASMMMEQYLTGEVKRKNMKREYINKVVPNASVKKQ
jgi:penicillin-binding protein 2